MKQKERINRFIESFENDYFKLSIEQKAKAHQDFLDWEKEEGEEMIYDIFAERLLVKT